MLAQPEGLAYYDRLSWEAPLSTITGCVMVGVLSLVIGAVFQPDRYLGEQATTPENADAAPRVGLVAPHQTVELATQGDQILAADHLATLGGQLFGRHLMEVEVAGTLLLVALVGTVAIVLATRVDPSKEGARHG